MNQQVVEITKEDPRIACDYCHLSAINSLEWGPMYKLDGVTIHYFCMLFSAGLSQNGEDDQGILGFLPEDIKRELRRGDKLRCKYCRNTRATIGCSVKTCKTSYHYPCGLRQGSIFHFIGNFESYCSRHKENPRIPLPRKEWECPICFTDVKEDDLPLWPPCCKKRVFHKLCIMEMAKNHGAHFFKCPLCNDKEIFSVAMRKSGVYLPDRDATWETGNAFEDHARLYSRCDAIECLCPKGRDHSSKSESKPWKLVRCGACGAAGVHKSCGNLKNLTWRCPTCSSILSDQRKSEAFHSSRIQRHQYDSSSDEGDAGTETPIANVRDTVTTMVESSSRYVRDNLNEEDADTERGRKIQLFMDLKRKYQVDRDDDDNDDEDETDDDDDEEESNSEDDRETVRKKLVARAVRYSVKVDNIKPKDLKDIDSENSETSTSEDEDSESENVFISSEAQKKLRERKESRLKRKLDARNSNPTNKESESGNVSSSALPSFPPLGKDTLITSKSKEKVEFNLCVPNVIAESEDIDVEIPMKEDITFKPTESANVEQSNDEEIQILSCTSIKDSKNVETVSLEDDDSDDGIEVVEEKFKIPTTKSTTLLEIVNKGHGNVSRPNNHPLVRSHIQISNAFLRMIKDLKNKKSLSNGDKLNSSVKSRLDGQADIINLDSDDEETMNCEKNAVTKNSGRVYSKKFSKKRDRLKSTDPPSNVIGSSATKSKRPRT